MSLDHNEVVRLKKRHAELTKWKKAAETYGRQFGTSGNQETLQRHTFRERTAEVELPVIEKKLLNAWKQQPGSEEPPY